METDAEEHQKRLLVFVLMLALGIWIGASIAVAAIAVPTAFDKEVMPRDHAADFGAALFPRINLMEGILGATAVLAAGLLGPSGWGTARRHMIATTLVAVMTLLVLLFLFHLTPAIVDQVEILREMGIDLNDSREMPPERETLRVTHTLYAGLDVLKILAGITVMWLLATRRT